MGSMDTGCWEGAADGHCSPWAERLPKELMSGFGGGGQKCHLGGLGGMVQAHGKQMLAAGPRPREEAPAKLSPGLLRILVLNDVCWAYKNLPQLVAILALAAPVPT